MNQLCDLGGFLRAVSMDEREIRRGNGAGRWDDSPAERRARKQCVAVSGFRLSHASDEFRNAVRTQNRRLVVGVRLIANLHQHIAPATIEEPPRRRIRGTQSGIVSNESW